MPKPHLIYLCLKYNYLEDFATNLVSLDFFLEASFFLITPIFAALSNA